MRRLARWAPTARVNFVEAMPDGKLDASMSTAMARFLTAARKAEALILDFSNGEIDECGVAMIDRKRVLMALQSLDKRTSASDIRGDETTREPACARVSELRAKYRGAAESHYQMSQERRHKRVCELRAETARIANANAKPY